MKIKAINPNVTLSMTDKIGAAARMVAAGPRFYLANSGRAWPAIIAAFALLVWLMASASVL